MGVVKYIIGALICVAFIVFIVSQFKALIGVFRARRNKKSSEEGKDKDSAVPPSEVSEKEVDKE